jgi:hypothetical protein
MLALTRRIGTVCGKLPLVLFIPVDPRKLSEICLQALPISSAIPSSENNPLCNDLQNAPVRHGNQLSSSLTPNKCFMGTGSSCQEEINLE